MRNRLCLTTAILLLIPAFARGGEDAKLPAVNEIIAKMVAGDAQRQRSLGININLWWGLCILAFGAVMLLLCLRKKRPAQPAADRQSKTNLVQ